MSWKTLLPPVDGACREVFDYTLSHAMSARVDGMTDLDRVLECANDLYMIGVIRGDDEFRKRAHWLSQLVLHQPFDASEVEGVLKGGFDVHWVCSGVAYGSNFEHVSDGLVPFALNVLRRLARLYDGGKHDADPSLLLMYRTVQRCHTVFSKKQEGNSLELAKERSYHFLSPVRILTFSAKGDPQIAEKMLKFVNSKKYRGLFVDPSQGFNGSATLKKKGTKLSLDAVLAKLGEDRSPRHQERLECLQEFSRLTPTQGEVLVYGPLGAIEEVTSNERVGFRDTALKSPVTSRLIYFLDDEKVVIEELWIRELVGQKRLATAHSTAYRSLVGVITHQSPEADLERRLKILNSLFKSYKIDINLILDGHAMSQELMEAVLCSFETELIARMDLSLLNIEGKTDVKEAFSQVACALDPLIELSVSLHDFFTSLLTPDVSEERRSARLQNLKLLLVYAVRLNNFHFSYPLYTALPHSEVSHYAALLSAGGQWRQMREVAEKSEQVPILNIDYYKTKLTIASDAGIGSLKEATTAVRADLRKLKLALEARSQAFFHLPKTNLIDCLYKPQTAFNGSRSLRVRSRSGSTAVIPIPINQPQERTPGQ